MVKFRLRRNLKFRLYRNFGIGKISHILIGNFICPLNAFVQVIDIFGPQQLIISITALDQDSDFFKLVSDEKTRFKVILPAKNTITSETLIMANTSDFLPVYDLLVESEPRCITLYGLKENIEIDRLNYKEFQYADDKIVKKETIGYAISIILEECCVKITFNTDIYDPFKLFKTIKEKLQKK